MLADASAGGSDAHQAGGTLRDGVFGVPEALHGLRRPIQAQRLKAVPKAVHCVDCQEDEERQESRYATKGLFCKMFDKEWRDWIPKQNYC